MEKKKKELILKERARLLRAETRENEYQDHPIEVLKFILSSEKFAIHAAYVTKVVLMKDLTPLPTIPDFILGIVNVHGKILSVVDVRKFLGLPARELSDLNRIIVLTNNDLEFGILADEIIGYDAISENLIQNNLPVMDALDREFISGITRDRLIILNSKHLIENERIIINEDV